MGAGGETRPLVALGAGEIELNRSLRLLLCDGATGWGAANCAGAAVVVDIGVGKPGIDGFDAVAVVGEADWKSSKSSSSFSNALGAAFLPFEETSFGGVSGGTSSSKASISISGSFGLGGSGFLALTGSVTVVPVLRRAEEDVAPSSYSSYSSNRSPLLPESWNPDVFPP